MEGKVNKARAHLHRTIDDCVDKIYTCGLSEGKMEAFKEKESKARCEGVMDAWTAIQYLLKEALEENTVTQFLHTLACDCPFDLIAEVKQKRAEEEAEKEVEEEEIYIPKNFECVEDPSGHKCLVTNTDTHIHVLYPNGKTHKWDKVKGFKKISTIGELTLTKD